jgi:selenide,water dikinase
VAEAGGVVAGGHTVVDAEPKYGLCVTGRVHPERVLVKGGLRPGDRLFLSKPLGSGVIVTAAKKDAAGGAVLDGAIRSMLRLNRVAAEVARSAGARGATDITGFGLLGHVAEMVEASGVGISIDAARLPLLEGAFAAAEDGHWSGGMKRNQRHVEATLGARLSIASDLSTVLIGLLFEAETSGGLFFGAPASAAGGVVEEFRARGEHCWQIGEVTADAGIRVR